MCIRDSDYIEDLTDILTFAELEVRVKTVDMLQKDGMINRLEEGLKRTAKEMCIRDSPCTTVHPSEHLFIP